MKQSCCSQSRLNSSSRDYEVTPSFFLLIHPGHAPK